MGEKQNFHAPSYVVGLTAGRGGGGGGGGAANPTGTIISFMGTTAPSGYLSCDGTVYNISAYPDLAAHLAAQFGDANYFGGDGDTTFAVPDLQGEFLRGTGTNSHENSGSGAAAGVHQAATSHLFLGVDQDGGSIWIQSSYKLPGQTSIIPQNIDKAYPNVGTTGHAWAGKVDFQGSGAHSYTGRPTNTSVLYCIKT